MLACECCCRECGVLKFIIQFSPKLRRGWMAHGHFRMCVGGAAGMRYVVDAGRSKQKILDEGGSLAQYDVRWISKASAQQRAGRSGRTGPGHCYRSVCHLEGHAPAWLSHHFTLLDACLQTLLSSACCCSVNRLSISLSFVCNKAELLIES